MIELGLIDLRAEADVVRSHQTARTVASQLGFSTFEQTRIATAIAEIARNALIYAGGGEVTFGLDDARVMLVSSVLDRGPGIADLAGVLAGHKRPTRGMGLGITGARRLMDELAIESTSAGTRVEMKKRLARRAARVEPPAVQAVRSQLAGQLADDPTHEIRRLHHDIAERDQRIEDLTQELLDTNRGVMSLHAELEDRAEYQRQAVELRSRLLSEMGHELRTPLHSISTISQFLLDRLDGDLTGEQDKQVRIIFEVATSLTAYVNDLLDLARTDAGKATVHVARFAASNAINSVRRIMQPLVPPGVELRAVPDGSLPLIISDESKVAQVLRNLVANAIKFTERGLIEIRALVAGPDRIAFEVEDTGIGIPDEDQELVFREFAQVDGRVHSRMRGSGLGLPLSRRIAELLGGSLTLVSAPGRGSTFRFELPVAAPGDASDVVLPAIEPLRHHAMPSTGRPRILVIDDDLASRYVLARWLADRYEVEEAPSGQAGLALAASGPDVIFLDVIMPDLTGFEVLERLKADPATTGIPVIVYTALTLGTNDRERLGAATAILRKSTASRVADRVAIEDALVKAGIATPMELAGHG
jgi:signal transduction histidine kinase